MDIFSNYVCILVLYVILLSKHADADNSYILIAPNVMRPGQDLPIRGELLQATKSPVEITAEITGDGQVAKTVIVANRKQELRLDLSIPKDVKPSSNFNLKISGTGGLTFSSSKTLDFEQKSISIYIQTDKAIYKPGQTVNFRVFGVKPDLKIVLDDIQVELEDPKGNTINQWSITVANLTDLGGVYVGHQVLSDAPVLGQWKLKAKLPSYGSTFQEKTFGVEEYVLPTFEVNLDLPSYGKTTDKEFIVTVNAKYTFGKPVKGEVDLRIKPKNERIEWRNGEPFSVGEAFEAKFPIDGKATYPVPMSRLQQIEKFLSGSSLVFQANVTESLTKQKRDDKQEVSFYDKATKIEFPKSLPNTFKPGMKYLSVVKVSQQDDSAPDVINDNLTVTITEYSTPKNSSQIDVEEPFASPSSKLRHIWRPRPIPIETSTQLPPTYHSVPPDGIVEFPINVKSNINRIEVQAKYDGVTTSTTIKKRHSPSNTYIQLRPKTEKIKAGNLVEFEIKSTSSPGLVNYQIYARGILVDSGSIPMTTTQKSWKFSATSRMAPRTRIVVYFVRPDGEVVADAISVNIEGVFQNKVALSFNATKAAPADRIRLDVTADAGSAVHILGVDKSVMLMKTGNDLSKAEVLAQLQTFEIQSKQDRVNTPFCDWFCFRWPMPVGGEDVKDVFDDAGVLVFTDALVYEHIEPVFAQPLFFSRGSPQMAFNAQVEGMPAMAKAAIFERNLQDTSPKDLAPVQRTRTLFPETWLFQSERIPSSGKVSINEIIPDTITSWIATAFAFHPNSGLGLSENSAKLEVFLPFFISVIMPYSVIRGEKIILQANIHNYNSQSLLTYVKLEKSDDFENVVISGSSQSVSSTNITRTITVRPDEVVAVYFPIIPRKIGLADIKVTAQTAIMADAINKKLLIEPEGSAREYNIPFVIDLKETGSTSRNTTIEFPVRTVNGSERITATVIGDLMGPSIKGLDKLLKMPYGCGEQNMLNFAPNIFILMYLASTKQLENNILKTSKEYMEKGYQRELTYSHTDGSFSAFGNSDGSGSTWLTAFVLKSFVQAKPYIFIDSAVVHKAVDWLVKQQNTDGTFNEPGRVIHTEMQGGSTNGKVSLTAYVLISLLESRNVEGVASKITDAQNKAQKYLESEVPNLSDVYDLAVVLYALRLTGSTAADTVWQKLDAKAINSAGSKHWEKNTKTMTDKKPWERRNGVAIDIELTSYAVLALAKSNDRLNGLQVLKWITEQRNADGGFCSTQDTVLALQGLAEMAALIYSNVYNLDVSVIGTGVSERFHIDQSNARILQSRQLPKNVGTVSITANGQGLALVQIEVSYNIDDDDQKQSFDLTVSLPKETINVFDVKVCARWLDSGSSSMAVFDIGIPSGFTADISSVNSEPSHKRVEVESRKLIVYFDQITKNNTCSTMTMHRVGLVAGAQPVPVKCYDYYDPSKQVTTFYIPEAIRTSEVCDVCGAECEFCART